MTVNIEELREHLCHALCAEVGVSLGASDTLSVSLPLVARDGDHLTAYLKQRPAGWRVSDMGNTLMRLSYEHDLPRLLSGAREKLFVSTLMESGLQEDDGELFLDVPADNLTGGLFALAQGITRVEGLGLWSHGRVESTFYDDLRAAVLSSAPAEDVTENYAVPNIADSESYPVDFRIATSHRPLFLFGVNNKDKARLTTIVLLHLQAQHVSFDSMVVCADFETLARADRTRLMNAANDTVPSISNVVAIRQKIQHRRAAV